MIAGLAIGAAAIVALVAIVGLAMVTRRATRALRTAEDQLRQIGRSAVTEMEAVGRDAGDRLDRAVVRAEAAVAAAETASRLADSVLTAPAVKARAWGAGTAVAVRTFRKRRALRPGSD